MADEKVEKEEVELPADGVEPLSEVPMKQPTLFVLPPAYKKKKKIYEITIQPLNTDFAVIGGAERYADTVIPPAKKNK